ncbi:acetyltransferase [Alkalihalobacillus pseudalcaliphilus]|nr:acetyltransferase [Alkalihalobacillus pseudalcaliphilus]
MKFERLQDEIEDLIHLYTHTSWDFHADPKREEKEVRKLFQSGWFTEDKETYWVIDEGERIGLLVLGDISDTMPLFQDIRLHKKVRGKGYGQLCVEWAIDYIFSSSKEKLRMEAYTRADNQAMRRVFEKTLFQKEGYLRSSWEQVNGKVYDSILFAVIRADWEKANSL